MNPGPKLQLSSDAAEALGMLAGQPVTVDVTALKRVETPVPSPNPKAPALASNEAIQSKPIADIKAKASAAIDNAAAKGTKEAKTTAKAVAKTGPKAAPTMSAASAAAMAGGKTAPKAPASAPMKAAAGRDYVQIGIFSVEANAKRAARLMRAKGIPARILKEDSHGKTYSRVLAGPTTHARRDGLLAQVKKLGFTDAYFVNK
jgi:cell division septation protein DedD